MDDPLARYLAAIDTILADIETRQCNLARQARTLTDLRAVLDQHGTDLGLVSGARLGPGGAAGATAVAQDEPEGWPVVASAAELVERMIEEAKPEPGPWTPDKDYALVESLGRGCTAQVVADNLGLPRAAVVARYRELLPDPTIEAQARLIKRLSAQIAGS